MNYETLVSLLMVILLQKTDRQGGEGSSSVDAKNFINDHHPTSFGPNIQVGASWRYYILMQWNFIFDVQTTFLLADY